jgi:hypothetical protein
MYTTKLVAVIGLACLTTGCVNSSSETVTTLPPDMAVSGRVAAITIKAVPTDVSSDFRPTLEAELRAGLDKCAFGNVPLNLEVTVTDFKEQNAAKTILIGDSDHIKGQARLIEPDGGNVVGDYDISRSVGGGGIAGAVVMSNAEKTMAQGFAQEICDRAFTENRGSKGNKAAR